MANSWAGSFGFGYDALSRRTSLTRPNGVNTSYSYDSVSHLLSVLHQAGNTILDGAGYTYDAAGNRQTKTNYLNGVTSNYGYDLLYQLTQVTQGGSTTESYSYDAVGNRLSSLGVPTYNYNSSNELTSNSNGSYTYDNNGNTLTDAQGRSFTWDFENRLVQATNPGVGTTTFAYDPFGRRIQKSGPLGTTNYLYDGINLLGEVDSGGNVLSKYTQGPNVDEPFAELRSSSTTYYEPDGLGSITSLTNASGTIAGTYSYDAFGNSSSTTGTIPNASRFTGREFDVETGLYYYRSRYYDPLKGAFLSEDTAYISDGTSLYAYVDNDPLDETDPTGEDGIAINYDWYPVDTGMGFHLPLGHGAVIAVNPANGQTTYFQYGRYDSEKIGVVQELPVPNVVMGKDGLPTQDSLNNLYSYISKHYGHGSHVTATYHKNADYRKIIRFARKRKNDKHRKTYGLIGNNCKTFRDEAIEAGEAPDSTPAPK
jgi:RHS repeat-associated protein